MIEHDDITVVAIDASLHSAIGMLMFFKVTFEDHGWMTAVHGSSILDNHGRDIDLIMLPTEDATLTQDEVIGILRSVGMEIAIDEVKGHYRGIIGTFHDYLLDVTLVHLL